MAASSTVLSGTPSATTKPAVRDRRVTVFRVTAGVVSLLIWFGALTVLFLLAPWTLIGPAPGDYVAELHRWHHADAGALLGILIAGALAASIPDPRRRPVLIQAVLLGLAAMIVTSLIDELGFGVVAVPVVVTGIVIAAYPARRELLLFKPTLPVSLPLVGLAVAAAVPLLRNAWDNLRLQANDHTQHATEHHWSGSAAVAVALVLAGFLVATGRPGWRALGMVLGLTYLYLGVAAMTIPDHDGSWGTRGGMLAILAGAGFVIQTLVEGRRLEQAGSYSARDAIRGTR